MISPISAKFLIGKLPSRCQDQRLSVALRVVDALQRSNDLTQSRDVEQIPPSNWKSWTNQIIQSLWFYLLSRVFFFWGGGVESQKENRVELFFWLDHVRVIHWHQVLKTHNWRQVFTWKNWVLPTKVAVLPVPDLGEVRSGQLIRRGFVGFFLRGKHPNTLIKIYQNIIYNINYIS